MEDYQTVEYWDARTKKGIETGNLDDMIFQDGRLKAYRQRTIALLNAIIKPEWSVLDLACGFGFYAPYIKNYTGVDFSKEMIKLAKQKYPDKKFLVGDANSNNLGKFDCVLEVNSMKVLANGSEAKLLNIMSQYADKCVIIAEVDYNLIKYAKNI